MSIEKEFVPYEPALELKELGFNEPCFGYYKPNGDFNYIESNILKDFPYLAQNSEWKDLCGAPTFSQAFRWFRDKYGLYHIIHCPSKDVAIFTITGFGIPSVYSNVELKSYEDAELACLRKLIELVKNK